MCVVNTWILEGKSDELCGIMITHSKFIFQYLIIIHSALNYIPQSYLIVISEWQRSR